MTDQPPPQAPGVPGTPAPAKQGKGCLFYGCLVFLILFLVIAATAGITYWYVKRQLDAKPFTHNVDACRSGGSALAFNLLPGNDATVVNSTISGQGDCLAIAECAEGNNCSGSETVEFWNDIFLGNPEYGCGGDTTCLAWAPESFSLPFDFHHAIAS